MSSDKVAYLRDASSWNRATVSTKRASSGKSSTVTSPEVARVIRLSTSNDGCFTPETYRDTVDCCTPIALANAPCDMPDSLRNLLNRIGRRYPPCIKTQDMVLGLLLMRAAKSGETVRMKSFVLKPLDNGAVALYPAGMNTNPIQKLRLDAGMNQAELARRLGVPQSRVSRWEKGVCPHPPMTKRLAKLFGCPIDEIVDGYNPQFSKLAEFHKLIDMMEPDIAEEMHQACVKIALDALMRTAKVPTRKRA